MECPIAVTYTWSEKIKCQRFARAAGREAVGRPTPPIIGKAATAMSNKHDKSDPSIRNLKQSWDDKDATREKLEQREKQLFLEDQANQIFAPIEDYFTRLDKVLHRVRASAKIEAMWECAFRRCRSAVPADPDQSFRSIPISVVWRKCAVGCISDFSVQSWRQAGLSPSP